MKKFFYLSLVSLLYFTSLAIFSLFSPCPTLASHLLWEEKFTNPNLSKWTKYPNAGKIDIINKWLVLSSKKSSYPYMYAHIPLLASDQFKIEIKFKYTSISPWGTGIIIGDEIPQNNADLDFLVKHDSKVAMFKIWQDQFGLKIKYHPKSDENFSNAKIIHTEIANTVNHTIVIFRKDGYDHFSLDGNDLGSNSVKRDAPKYIALGNSYFLDSPHVWNNLSVDYIRITKGNEEKPAIVFLPGLGGSWNTEAILLGQSRPQSEWRLTPFAQFYSNLLDTLDGSGNSPLRFYYDWRKHIDSITADLDAFIKNKIPDDKKIVLIGHSLGGVVARAYLQKYDPQDQRIDKIITLGSPHQGAVQAYEALAGGKAYDRFTWVSVGNEILIAARGLFYNTPAEMVRKEASGFQDIVPTFDFIKRNGRTVSAAKVHFANNFLPSLNQSFGQHNYPIEFFVGDQKGLQVSRWLLLRSQTANDRFYNLWPDGSPRRIVTAPGDGTVLASSAHLNGNIYKFSLSHHGLAANHQSIGKIMSLLGMSGQIITNPMILSRNNTLIFLVGSPVQTLISDDQGHQYVPDNQGFVIIPNPPSAHFTAHLVGTDSGTAHFLVARLTPKKDYLNYYRIPIQTGRQYDYHFQINFNNPQTSPLASTNDILNNCQNELQLLRQNHNSPNLTNVSHDLQNALASNHLRQHQNILNALNHLFSFRRENLSQNQTASRPVLTCLGQALIRNNRDINYSSSSAQRDYYHARRYYSLISRLFRLHRRRRHKIKNPAISDLYQAKEKLVAARQSYRHHQYYLLAANSQIASRLLKEALRSYR